MTKYIDTEPYTVIGLSGKAHSGKDYLAQSIIDTLDFLALSIAHWFKCEGVEFEGIPFNETFGPEEKGEETRKFYQKRGTEKGREKHGKDVWINILEMYMHYFGERGFKKFVISDIRYPNEADWIHEFDGLVYRIQGRGGAETEETQNHKSETAMSNYQEFDGYVDNSEENEDNAVDDLFRKIYTEKPKLFHGKNITYL